METAALPRPIPALALALLCAACAGPNAQADLAPAAGHGTVILSVPHVVGAASVQFATFDPARQEMTGNPLSGFETIDLATASDHFYVWRQLPAGTYVIQFYSQQNNWMLCFSHASRSFTVNPGDKLYLGHLNTDFLSRELTMDTVNSGQTRTSRNAFVTFFAPLTPGWSDAEVVNLNLVGGLQVASGLSVAGVAPAHMQQAAFKTGVVLLSTTPVCGGYFRS